MASSSTFNVKTFFPAGGDVDVRRLEVTAAELSDPAVLAARVAGVYELADASRVVLRAGGSAEGPVVADLPAAERERLIAAAAGRGPVRLHVSTTDVRHAPAPAEAVAAAASLAAGERLPDTVRAALRAVPDTARYGVRMALRKRMAEGAGEEELMSALPELAAESREAPSNARGRFAGSGSGCGRRHYHEHHHHFHGPGGNGGLRGAWRRFRASFASGEAAGRGRGGGGGNCHVPIEGEALDKVRSVLRLLKDDEAAPPRIREAATKIIANEDLALGQRGALRAAGVPPRAAKRLRSLLAEHGDKTPEQMADILKTMRGRADSPCGAFGGRRFGRHHMHVHEHFCDFAS